MLDPKQEKPNGLCGLETLKGLLLKDLQKTHWGAHEDEADKLQDLFLLAPLVNITVSRSKNPDAPKLYLKAIREFLEW